MKKITLLNLLFALCAFTGFGQTMVDDFESGSGGLVANAGGITTTVVANPNPSGINTTANCLELKRTATGWWVLAGINLDPDMAISGSEIKYLSMMVYYPAQPDIACRFAGPNDSTNGPGGTEVRALNTYQEPYNTWQQIVFEIKDNTAATSFSYGTVYRIDFHPDMGYKNNPVGQVLDAAGTIAGYIDQIQISDSNPLSNEEFKLENNISIYPNPTKSEFSLTTSNNTRIVSIAIFDILGAQVTKNISKLSNERYDISNLSSGMYLMKIQDDNGDTAIKRLVKN